MTSPVAPAPRRGRRPTDIPLAKIEAFCQVHATDEEIAAHFSVSTKTIQRLKKKPAYAAAFAKGHADGKISLRRAQYQEALKGSPSMLIWLGKQLLGQKEKFEHTGANGGPVQIAAVRDMLDRLSDEDFAKLAEDHGVEVPQLSAAQTVIDVTPTPSPVRVPTATGSGSPLAGTADDTERDTYPPLPVNPL